MENAPQQDNQQTNNKGIGDYLFKPSLICSIIFLILWVVSASISSAFIVRADSPEWFTIIRNLTQTLSGISASLLWALFLPGLVVSIVFLSIKNKHNKK